MTHTERTAGFGGRRKEIEKKPFRPLRYNYCRLTLNPAEVPVCNRKTGIVYDKEYLRCFY